MHNKESFSTQPESDAVGWHINNLADDRFDGIKRNKITKHSIRQKVFQQKPLSFYLGSLLIGSSLLLNGCGDSDDSAPTPTPATVTMTATPNPFTTTMVGSTVGIATATISGKGISTVTAVIDAPAFVVALSDPNPCELDVDGVTTCDFTIDSVWSPESLDNSANDALVTEAKDIAFSATNADVVGSPVATKVITPYIYLPAVANNGAAENDGGTGIQYGAGTNIDPRFELGTQANGADCPGGEEIRDDNLTGLTWSQNANMNGTMNWANANIYFNLGNGGPNDGAGLCGYTDWRLPTVNELQSLVNYGGNPASYLNNEAEFTNVQGDEYWSSTVDASDPGNEAWYVDMNPGNVGSNDQGDSYYVWPVRGGQ